MLGFIEGPRFYGDIPGHVFRGTRVDQRLKLSVIGRIDHRVGSFANTDTATGADPGNDRLSRVERVAGRVRRLRYIDRANRRQIVDFMEKPVSDRASLGQSYLDLPLGTVFIGQEPTTMASTEAMRQRQIDQLGRLRDMLQRREIIGPEWFDYVGDISEKAKLEEPLQKPT